MSRFSPSTRGAQVSGLDPKCLYTLCHHNGPRTALLLRMVIGTKTWAQGMLLVGAVASRLSQKSSWALHLCVLACIYSWAAHLCVLARAYSWAAHLCVLAHAYSWAATCVY